MIKNVIPELKQNIAIVKIVKLHKQIIKIKLNSVYKRDSYPNNWSKC